MKTNMIKIAFRKNHIYLVILFFSYFIRRILSIIINKNYALSNSLIFCYFMCLGQMIGGFIISCYQGHFLKQKGNKSSRKRKIFTLIKTEKKMKQIDKYYKIYFLIFLASLFDLEEYFIISDFIPKVASLSTTSDLRLCFIMTVSSSLICIFALKYKIGRHQILSMIILSICSLIIIILEFIYKPENIRFSKYITSFILLILHFVFRSFTDVIEKYLGEYNYISPFKMIMIEGISTFIMTSIYAIFNYRFKEIVDVYNKINTLEFIVLILLLFLYFIFCALVNIYKTYCNVLYSPMAKCLASYFLNSAFIIYHYAFGNDFISDGKKNFFYFFINLIFSIIIDLFGLVYNEFFVLNFCNLSEETYHGITYRLMAKEMDLIDKNKARESSISFEDE